MPHSNRMITPLDVIESARESHSLPPCFQRPSSPLYPESRIYKSPWKSSQAQYIRDGSFPRSNRFMGAQNSRALSPSSSSNDSGTYERKSRAYGSNDFSLRIRAPKNIRNNEGYYLQTGHGKVLEMSPTGSLGRDVVSHYSWDGQSLGIPKTLTVSNYGSSPYSFMSQDSIPLSGNSESAYGSINSSIRSNSVLDRSSSLDTLNRRYTKEAVMKNLSEHYNEESSSDEELVPSTTSSLLGSENSLNKIDHRKKSKSSRTERYLRRKSMELETLKNASEKDKRNREVVIAKLVELQNLKKRQDYIMRNSKKSFPLVYPLQTYNYSLDNIPHHYFNDQNYQTVYSEQHKRIPYKSVPHSNSMFAFNSPKSNLNIPSLNSKMITNPPLPPPRKTKMNLNNFNNRPVSYSFENLSSSPQSSFYYDNKVNKSSHHIQDMNQSGSFNRLASPSSDYASYLSDNSMRNGLVISPSRDYCDSTYSPIARNKIPVHASQARLVYPKNVLSNNSKSSEYISFQPVPKERHFSINKQLIYSRKRDSDSENQEHKANVPPDPPKRTSSNISKYHRKYIKDQLQESLKENKEARIKFKQFLTNERMRVGKSNRAELKAALRELEILYESLNLESEDIIDGAERREKEELIKAQDECDARKNSITKKLRRRRTLSPDIIKDDFHLRQLRSEVSLHPDVLVSLLCGSYLNISPIYNNLLIDKVDSRRKSEPNIVTDDLSLRNMQRANSDKVLDPQPPFGIPVGPIIQGPRTDYLEVDVNTDQPDSLNSNVDDFGFRCWRKDKSRCSTPQLPHFGKLNEKFLLSPGKDIFKSRSSSVDRIYNNARVYDDPDLSRLHILKNNRFYENRLENKFRQDNENYYPDLCGRFRNPSWVERAHLVDNKFDTLVQTTIKKHTVDSYDGKVFKPDIGLEAKAYGLDTTKVQESETGLNIRKDVVSESKYPSAAPEDERESSDSDYEFLNRYPKPKRRSKWRSSSTPPDFNNTPKPFYLSENKSEVSMSVPNSGEREKVKKKKKSITRKNSDRKSPKMKRMKPPADKESSTPSSSSTLVQDSSSHSMSRGSFEPCAQSPESQDSKDKGTLM